MDNQLSIDGVQFDPQTILSDERGAVMHMLNQEHPSMGAFGEVYFSKIHPGVTKGWKQHLRLTQRLIAPVGIIQLTIYDARDASASQGCVNRILLGPEAAYGLLIIPPKLWYAFSNTGEGDALLCNCISEIHDPTESQTCPLDDPSMPQIHPFKESSMTDTQPLVSVIINCYNGERYLKEAIDSVYAQSYTHWEIIFWDNQSTDQSGAIAQSYDHRLRYHRAKTHLPLYAARNLSLGQCRGALIAFIDADDVWLPEKLAKQVVLFQNPDVGMVYSAPAVFYSSAHQSTQPRITTPLKKLPEGCIFENLLRHYVIHIHATMVRKSTLEEHRIRFSDQLNLTGDMVFFLKVAYHSKVACFRGILSCWRSHSQNLSKAIQSEYVKECMIGILEVINHNPDILAQHASAIRQFVANMHFHRAKIKFIKGEKMLARNILRSHTPWTVKPILLRLLTYLPDPILRGLVLKNKEIIH